MIRLIDMKTAPIPSEILEKNKREPMALIDFLKGQRTVMLPDMKRIEETVERRKSDGSPVEVRRGYGYDCNCWGTGWKNGQVLCGQHIPDESNRYILNE